jgi:nitrite reductase/ring-hydroxylating ferredoxin subunit
MAMTATSRSEAAVLDQGCVVVSVGGQTVALFDDDGVVRAVDNRCPHMGFPLHRGSVCDGILTCHWHHARFDLASGGTLDQWADDVPAFPVEIRDGEVFVDVALQRDERAHRRRRLRDGLERNISLVIAKSAIALTPEDTDAVFEAGLEFGVRASADGWGQGLTILTALRNLLPLLEPDERAHALHHGLAAVASDCDGMPPRHPVAPLPSQGRDADTVERWFRRCVEVRDAEGAERAIASAVRGGEAPSRVAAMLYAAATDHRYLTTGHVLDFTTKSLEALDHAGWAHAEVVLGSLARLYAEADRAEESNQWRSPVDLVAILDEAFALMPDALTGPRQRWTPPDGLTELLLGDEPRAIAAALMDALRAGAAPADVAAEVTYAAAMRIARFPLTNEFTDWDTALHTFTFANAVEQGLHRTGSAELVRGVFDAAMSVFLDRFLNTPPARLPDGDGEGAGRDRLFELLDRQQQVDAAGSLTAGWLDDGGGDAPAVISALVTALLREDRNFHTIQMIEAAVRQHGSMPPERGRLVLIAGARYLAAHAPTARAQTQTYRIAWRLNRGETLFE